MTKLRKILNSIILTIAVLFVVLPFLTSCGSKTYTVTFNIEGKTETVETVDGKVSEMPSDPKKDYYIFMGWYTTETFDEGTEFTKDTAVSGDITVYAYFAPERVNISVNGEASIEIKLVDLSTKEESYKTDANSKDLTFDGWYVDSNYTTKYTTQSVDNLYARYMATVTYNNGYEDVYETIVKPNETTTKPSTDDVVKYYMDSEDISYIDSEGNEFDFTQTISTNTTITVLWKTPYLVYELIDGTASDYEMIGLSRDYYEKVANYPVISFLSQNVTVDENGTKGNVVAVNGVSTSSSLNIINYIGNANTIIFNEGIKSIYRFDGCTGNVVENIVLPESLKIIEDSFCYFRELKSLDIPSGVEVIADSFWADCVGGMSGTDSLSSNLSGYNFTITIPSSVKVISNLPYNVVFEEGSKFYAEENRIYYNDDEGNKILVCDYQTNVSNGKLEVKEGVYGIQVGTFEYIDMSYLSLPATFEEVIYATDKDDYSYYTGKALTSLENVNKITTGRAYVLISNLDDMSYVTFNATSYPTCVTNNAYLFSGDGKPYTEFDEDKLVLIGVVDSGDITVSVSYINTMLETTTSSTSFSVETGTSLTKSDILTNAGLTEETLGYPILATTFTQLGEDFIEGEKNCNQYIYIEYTISVKGFTYELDSSTNEYVVTGFDETTAYELSDGTYLVVISNEINDVKITKIADEAFKDVTKISKIYISSSVKEIGAKAFMNTSNLQEITISAGGLEKIGESAFENVGCVLQDGEYVINPDLSTIVTLNGNKKASSVRITIPLANITTIEPYAFKSIAIVAFIPVESEETRFIVNSNATTDNLYIDVDSLTPNGFYFYNNGFSTTCGIVQYISSSTIDAVSAYDGSSITKTIVDVKYYAMAAGAYHLSSLSSTADSSFAVGHSASSYFYGAYAKFFASLTFMEKAVMRFEMMEGSAYFVDTIHIGIVSTIHKNAFTGIDTDNVTIAVYYNTNDYTSDSWVELEDVQNQSSSIFEDGWLNGNANSDNTTLMEAVSTTTDSLS